MRGAVMELVSRFKNHVEQNRERLVAELVRFLSQPSVSTTGLGIEETVHFLDDEMKGLGFSTQVWRLDGANPAVFGEAGDLNSPVSLCVYGHYDVQAPDPLGLWHSDPFQPEIRNGLIYARGATDDKGNLFANLKAAEAVLTLLSKLPIRLKFFFEGEEEIGSPNLRRYLKTYGELLRSGATVLCDRGIHESGRPQIYLGNKGMVSVRVLCRRAGRDVHSGHAPLIPSSTWDLIRFLASLKHGRNQITIPGYCDQVMPPSEEELALLKSIPFDAEKFRTQYGIPETLVQGEALDMLRALLFEPTANVSGITSGWVGEKPKTIIPAEATALLDFRLVKGQDPESAGRKIANAIETSPFGPFDFELNPQFEEYRCNPRDPWVLLAMEVAREVTGLEPVVWPLLDGSGPLCWFHRDLGGPTFIIGLGSPFETANTHAPNENIGIAQYLTGIAQMGVYFCRAADFRSERH
jgi:acetylornithine deacetylase/succinyl-diaminopimelate desuccinylase-like protein